MNQFYQQSYQEQPSIVDDLYKQDALGLQRQALERKNNKPQSFKAGKAPTFSKGYRPHSTTFFDYNQYWMNERVKAEAEQDRSKISEIDRKLAFGKVAGDMSKEFGDKLETLYVDSQKNSSNYTEESRNEIQQIYDAHENGLLVMDEDGDLSVGGKKLSETGLQYISHGLPQLVTKQEDFINQSVASFNPKSFYTSGSKGSRRLNQESLEQHIKSTFEVGKSKGLVSDSDFEKFRRDILTKASGYGKSAEIEEPNGGNGKEYKPEYTLTKDGIAFKAPKGGYNVTDGTFKLIDMKVKDGKLFLRGRLSDEIEIQKLINKKLDFKKTDADGETTTKRGTYKEAADYYKLKEEYGTLSKEEEAIYNKVNDEIRAIRAGVEKTIPYSDDYSQVLAGFGARDEEDAVKIIQDFRDKNSPKKNKSTTSNNKDFNLSYPEWKKDNPNGTVSEWKKLAGK